MPVESNMGLPCTARHSAFPGPKLKAALCLAAYFTVAEEMDWSRMALVAPTDGQAATPSSMYCSMTNPWRPALSTTAMRSDSDGSCARAAAAAATGHRLLLSATATC
eukprot:2906612-Pyramimonas_sp.AAC.1